MFQIKNLTITHRKDLRVILEDFSCVLNDSDKAVIIGEEGNGKSTLMKWIYEPKQIEDYCEADGERIINGERLGYLPQELGETDCAKSVYEFFLEEERFLERTPGELAKMARNFHLPPEFYYMDQKVGTLSGGEKVKAQMMRLLLAEPTVLLLDEPSNDIDLETLEWLEDLICSWPHIVLFISHDETLIERTANMVIHLEQIKRKTRPRYTVARVPYIQYKRERENQFEKQAQQAASDRREKKKRDEKYQRIYQSVEHAQNVITRQDPSGGRLLKKKMHAVKAMERRFAREDENMTEMPDAETSIFFKLGDADSAVPAGKTVLEYSLDRLYAPQSPEQSDSSDAILPPRLTAPANSPYFPEKSDTSDTPDFADRGRLLARGIFLRVRGPEKICIIGANGAGKTTLLRKIAEELLARTDLKAEYMPQNYEELLNLHVTPVEYLAKTGDRSEYSRIRTYLGALKYTADEMDHPIAELSGGQKAKVFLLKMSMSRANVLILDEPTRNFSPLSGPVIRRMLREFPGAIISVSHDRKYISEVCDQTYLLTEKGLELFSRPSD